MAIQDAVKIMNTFNKLASTAISYSSFEVRPRLSKGAGQQTSSNYISPINKKLISTVRK